MAWLRILGILRLIVSELRAWFRLLPVVWFCLNFREESLLALQYFDCAAFELVGAPERVLWPAGQGRVLLDSVNDQLKLQRGQAN